MVINNSETLRALHKEAGWKPGDDSSAIYALFTSRMRDRAADETAAPWTRRKAHEDLVSIARMS